MHDVDRIVRILAIYDLQVAVFSHRAEVNISTMGWRWGADVIQSPDDDQVAWPGDSRSQLCPHDYYPGGRRSYVCRPGCFHTGGQQNGKHTNAKSFPHKFPYLRAP